MVWKVEELKVSMDEEQRAREGRIKDRRGDAPHSIKGLKKQDQTCTTTSASTMLQAFGK